VSKIVERKDYRKRGIKIIIIIKINIETEYYGMKKSKQSPV